MHSFQACCLYLRSNKSTIYQSIGKNIKTTIPNGSCKSCNTGMPATNSYEVNNIDKLHQVSSQPPPAGLQLV